MNSIKLTVTESLNESLAVYSFLVMLSLISQVLTTTISCFDAHSVNLIV